MTFKPHPYSEGIGLYGTRSTTYIVPVLNGKAAYDRWKLEKVLLPYSGYARLLKVRSSEMEVVR